MSLTPTINIKHIQAINDDRYQSEQVKYVKCPVCRILMNRVSFGYRSGVVVDRCGKHGIWLDNGEITHNTRVSLLNASGQEIASSTQLKSRADPALLAELRKAL